MKERTFPWDEIKDRLVYRLVNREYNREILKERVNRQYHDLAIVYYASVYSRGGISMMLPVTNEYMEQWGTTEEELYRLAQSNTPRLFPPLCESMTEMLDRMLGRDDGEGERAKAPMEKPLMEKAPMEKALIEKSPIEKSSIEEPSFGLYILTNRDMMNGAAAVLYPGVLQDAARRLGGDLVMLPSSIHEVLLLPYCGEEALSKAAWVVREVNRYEVAEDEVLSNHVYVYRRDTDRLEMRNLYGEEAA